MSNKPLYDYTISGIDLAKYNSDYSITTFYYKGYIGSKEFSEEDNLWYGKIQNINDLVGYHSEIEQDLGNSFKNAVNDYIEIKERIK